MMKHFFSLLFILAAGFYTKAQQVNLITLNDLDKRLANGKDTTYVINFWATWCKPCVEELPLFEQLHRENTGKPLKVILISLDFKSKLQTQVLPFVVKNKLTAQVFLLNETNQQAYIERVDKKWSGAIPATLIVRQNSRRFYEQSFTESELKNAYLNFK